jgi:glucose/arabinose dehydrogenase
LAVAVSITLATACVGWARPAAGAGTTTIELRKVGQLTDGTAIAARPHDTSVYIAEQGGDIRVLRGGRLRGTVLDLTDVVSQDGGERGLLGLAFSPDGRQLYTDYTDRNGDTQVVEFAMREQGGREQPDPASRRTVLSVAQPQPNHNGGQLAFGPDGYLYIALGDGGAAGDVGPGHAPGGNAQSLATLLGKILRIDPTPSAGATYTVPADNPFVGRSGARGEIWAYGVRNPWRFSFDTATGDLWIGDVGQGEWEEVDRAPAASGRNAGRGDNFGWNRVEGTHSYEGGVAPPGTVEPVFEVSHDDGACSVIGGYVYRGRAIPDLRGTYLFTDYCRGELRGLVPRGEGDVRAVDLGASADQVSAFGQRDDGELFVLSQSSGLYRIVAG